MPLFLDEKPALIMPAPELFVPRKPAVILPRPSKARKVWNGMWAFDRRKDEHGRNIMLWCVLPGIGFQGGGGPIPTSVATKTYTQNIIGGFSNDDFTGSVAIGTATADRMVVIGTSIYTASGGIPGVTAFTLGGFSMNLLQSGVNGTGTCGNRNIMGWLNFGVGGGTSATFFTQYSSLVDWFLLCSWSVYGAQQLSPWGSISGAQAADTNSVGATINIPNNGCCVAHGAVTNNDASNAISGLTTDDETNFVSSGAYRFACRSQQGMTADAAHSITYSSGTGGSQARTLTASSWF